MPHQLLAIVIAGVVSVAALLLGGAALLARDGPAPPAACGPAAEWRAAAELVQRTGSAVDPHDDDESGVISLVRAVRGLARVPIPPADEASVHLVAAMHETDDAGSRWLAEGLEYASLVHSGMSSEVQRAIALEEFDVSGREWERATERASAQLEAACGLPPIAAGTADVEDEVAKTGTRK